MAKDLSIYTINPSLPFLRTLAKGLWEQYEKEDFLSDVRILLPTRRAGRILQEQFLDISKGAPLILPQISSVGDVDIDELSLTTSINLHSDIPPSISPLRRQLLLSELISKIKTLSLSETHAFSLAGSLAVLLDQIHTEDSDINRLDNIVREDLSDQWGLSLQFLSILKDAWPEKLKELGLIDPADRRKRLMKALIAHWKINPPQTHIIAAGSTGSIPVTADLLKTVALLPNGEVILPGLDLDMGRESWGGVEEGHPQATLKLLLERIGVRRDQVQHWTSCKHKNAFHREELLREVTRPASTISEWGNSLAKLNKSNFENFHILECDSEEEEAKTIASILRETIETENKTAALVTPDRNLAERVSAALSRWHIKIDDSAGIPLSKTSIGYFANFVIQAAKEGLSPISLLALLKHPYTRFGYKKSQITSFLKQLDEGDILRGPWHDKALSNLLYTLNEDPEKQHLATFLKDIQTTLSPLETLLKNKEKNLYETTKAHIQACETIATSPDEAGASRLWKGEQEGELSRLFQTLLSSFSEQSENTKFFEAPHHISYLTIFNSQLSGTAVRPKYGTHPRLFILGQLEARLIHADRVILAGLNEDTWPALPAQDPWMSRGMRQAMGLPLPERNITLSAHDFVQGACAKEVFLTRSTRKDNVPTVPARWLQRLRAICEATSRNHIFEDTSPYILWCRKADEAENSFLSVLEAPYPLPPTEKRPREFSVSSLELLMRDPYSLYAKQILNLKPLKPLEEEEGPKEKGSHYHKILHDFCEKYPVDIPNDGYDKLIQIGKDTFGAALDNPSLWVSWWPRFENMASWFIDHEKEWRGKGYSFSAGEVEGRTLLDGYTLSARADRIDRHTDKSYAVIDYKTGSSPFSNKDVAAGFYPQLPVEALILQDNKGQGFENLDAGETSYMGYWHITGSGEGGTEAESFKSKKPPVENVIEQAEIGISEVLKAYENSERGYPSCPFSGKEPAYPDYEHLSRILEWGTSGDNEEAA